MSPFLHGMLCHRGYQKPQSSGQNSAEYRSARGPAKAISDAGAKFAR